MLIGGGARGRAWRDAVARLSGRAVQVPEAEELVALGAAAQAARAADRRGDPATIARALGHRGGRAARPAAERDDETLARIRATREAAGDLLDP